MQVQSLNDVLSTLHKDEQIISATVTDDLHFLTTASGKLCSVVTVKNEAQTLLERLLFAWHVLLGHEMEVVLDHPTIARIAAKFNVHTAIKNDPQAAEAFAMNGTEDVLQTGAYATPNAGETPAAPEAHDDHAVATMVNEGGPGH